MFIKIKDHDLDFRYSYMIIITTNNEPCVKFSIKIEKLKPHKPKKPKYESKSNIKLKCQISTIVCNLIIINTIIKTNTNCCLVNIHIFRHIFTLNY